MTSSTFEVPILVIIYDRPGYLEILLGRLAEIRPSKVHVFCDGLHDGGDREGMDACKALVAEFAKDREVATFYRDSNLGPGRAIAEAMDWFFGEVPEGIVLEADCIPARSFFPYCRDMLGRFRDDPKVSLVCGNNFAEWASRTDAAFSTNLLIWGFATWRRTWLACDRSMSAWSEPATAAKVRAYFRIPLVGRIHHDRLDRFHRHEILTGRHGSWDFQLLLSQILADSLTIVPGRNLVSNIGSEGGVNHRRKMSFHHRPVDESFEIRTMPDRKEPDLRLDLAIFVSFFLPDWLRMRRSLVRRALGWRRGGDR